VKVGITGGAGFIGGATVRAVRQSGWEPVLFDHANGHDVLGDLSALDGCNRVIHLAGALGTSELFDTPERAVVANVVGALRVLQWCERNGVGYTGITMPPVFPSVYTATKICADRLADAWRLFRGVPATTVRAFNAYGPGQKHGPGHPQKIIPTFATEAWAGRPIPVWGDGTQTADLVHVDDLGRMLADACLYGDGEVFDGGTGVPLTVNEIAEFVISVTGSEAGVRHLPMRDGESPTKIAATGSGWDLLGWYPEHDWDRLAETIRWYKP
jgi:UDP-glucose 4-epimerase